MYGRGSLLAMHMRITCATGKIVKLIVAHFCFILHRVSEMVDAFTTAIPSGPEQLPYIIITHVSPVTMTTLAVLIPVQ